MKRQLERNPLVTAAISLCLMWNLVLLIGVVANAGFAHSRAAGGRYTEFPSGVRILYLVQLILVIYEVWILRLLLTHKPVKPIWVVKFFIVVGVLGTLVNAASRGANERWNVIPAVIITWAFWYFGKKSPRTNP